MTCNFDFVEGDNAILKVTCLDNSGNIIDLTGATVVLSWETAYPASAPVSKNMTITNAAAGLCEYQFGASELYSPLMKFDISITDASLNVFTNSCDLELSGRQKVTA